MHQRDPDDEPTTGSGDPQHRTPGAPEEPVTTGSGDPQHRPEQENRHGDRLGG
ncbi:hypothetical protein [Luteibacter sp. ME-Dv--P-043b]|uniref:hypothetical protein n=1 Tax=Luteibacter sp. ME-Dv--P-043b TaxID=3040291 RepID=UPI002556D810|nr:hypothetical protein [Luteibacter sp. ME-Dv--P-043b]